jgi:hypothetical protein
MDAFSSVVPDGQSVTNPSACAPVTVTFVTEAVACCVIHEQYYPPFRATTSALK